MVERVLVTDEAAKIIEQLREQHGTLIFHQSGGCCDGSAPMCLPKDDFMLDESDVWMGKISGCDFYMNRDQFEYWKHTQLTIDIVEGRGASFSAEIPLGLRFIIDSRLFKDEEIDELRPIRYGEEIIEERA